jgi:NADH:ubiquinone oxidoreductase subunit 6 (subunit J)
MYTTPYPLINSAWPTSIVLIIGVILPLHLLLWKSPWAPWALIPWLSLAGVVVFPTGALLIASILISFTPNTPGVISPLAFAGPLFIALLFGVMLLGLLWFVRPSLELVRKKHWVIATCVIPITVMAILYSPHLFEQNFVIRCEVPKGINTPEFELQRLGYNNTSKFGLPFYSTNGVFHIRINTREKFVANINSKGFQSGGIYLSPSINKENNKEYWYYTGDGETRELPMKGTVELQLHFKKSESNEPGAAANASRR